MSAARSVMSCVCICVYVCVYMCVYMCVRERESARLNNPYGYATRAALELAMLRWERAYAAADLQVADGRGNHVEPAGQGLLGRRARSKAPRTGACCLW